MAVNRKAQCARIAEVTAEVIAREGIEAATVRRISAEIGCSTSAVTYYFADKHELLVCAYESLNEELYGKIRAVLERDPADLAGCLLCMTPADEVSFNRWRTYVDLWGVASRDEAWLARERKDVAIATAQIADVIRVRNGEIADIDDVSRHLNVFIQGVAVQTLMDRESWPGAKIRQAIETMIDRLIGPPAMRAATG